MVDLNVVRTVFLDCFGLSRANEAVLRWGEDGRGNVPVVGCKLLLDFYLR